MAGTVKVLSENTGAVGEDDFRSNRGGGRAPDLDGPEKDTR